jgi:mannose-6-phosphate isomerase-like protein (cupin superfamily)
MLIKYEQVKPFISKDGSSIRELIHPGHHGNNNQSLAEAIIPAGSKTALHLHRTSEEIYHVTQGEALMTLGMKTFTISVGDTVLIPPLTAHCLQNNHHEDLHVLCACSPAYKDEDTELLDY